MQELQDAQPCHWMWLSKTIGDWHPIVHLDPAVHADQPHIMGSAEGLDPHRLR